MKALWTILLSLALAWSPSVVAAPTAARVAKASPCKHCDCGGTGCCVDEAPTSLPPVPAVPVLPAAPGHDLALLFCALRDFALPSPRELEVDAARSFDAPLPAVPLQARYCCFLI